jgi:hypothetical protein
MRRLDSAEGSIEILTQSLPKDEDFAPAETA